MLNSQEVESTIESSYSYGKVMLILIGMVLGGITLIAGIIYLAIKFWPTAAP